ncbi:putative hexose transporter [Cryptosporidium felis]|nr:putative hexose transporter [Cryptosporidium felis]
MYRPMSASIFLMEFSLVSYSQKRILAAGGLSLLSGYVLGITNVSRLVLIYHLSCGSLGNGHVLDRIMRLSYYGISYEGCLMIVINSSLLVGAAFGSGALVFMEGCIGKVKNILISFFLFGSGSFLCMSRRMLLFSAGRFISGVGVGISFNLVPSYIHELTDRQNQSLFSTLNTVFFCCGILQSYLLSTIVSFLVDYVIYLEAMVQSRTGMQGLVSGYLSANVRTPQLGSPYIPTKAISNSITRDNILSTLSVRILFMLPACLSLSLLIIWVWRLRDETPSYYIKLNDIRSAEDIARKIYGAYDTTRIISQLREDRDKEDISALKLLVTLIKSPIRRVLILIPIIACAEVLTGYLPLAISSNSIMHFLGIEENISSKYIVLSGCFLVNATFSGIFFEVYIGSKKLFVLGLILILISIAPICLLLFYSQNLSASNFPIVISIICVTASCGFGVVPTTWRLISSYLSKKLYYSLMPYVYSIFWLAAVFSTILIEILPVLVFFVINTCFTLFVLISFTVINYQNS